MGNRLPCKGAGLSLLVLIEKTKQQRVVEIWVCGHLEIVIHWPDKDAKNTA